MDVFDLKAKISLDTSAYKKGLDQAEHDTVSFGNILKANLATDAIVKGLGLAKDAITGFAKGTLDAGMSFEAGMSKVSAISGASGEDFVKLKEKAQEMGATTKFSATESAEAMQYMAMAGWKTGDMLNGISGVMNLAAASGESLGTTSDIVTDALTAFGLSAEDSAHFADILARVSSDANTNVSMLGESFKYVAPVAGALGYSAEDTSVALGLMANAGIKASSAGTALRTLLTNMSKPTDTMAHAMDVLGVSMDDGNGKMLSFHDVMLQLRDGFKNNLQISTEQFGESLATLNGQLENGEITQKKYDKSVKELMERAYGAEEALMAENAAALAGKEGMSGLLAIVNASDEDFEKLTTSIANCDGAAEEMAAKMSDNLAGDITLFNSALESVQTTIYDKVSPALREFVQTGTEGLSALTTALSNGDLSGAVNAIGETFSNLGSLGADFISNLVSGIQTNAAKFFSSALDLTLGFSENLRSGAGSLIQSGLEIIVAIADGIISNIPKIIETVPQIISNFAGIINDNAPNVMATGVEIIVHLAEGLIKAIPTLIANIPQILKAMWDVFTAFQWLSLGKTIITAIKNGITSLSTSLPEALKSIGEKAGEKFKSINWSAVGKAVIDFLKNAISGGGNFIVEALKTIGNTASTAFKSIDWPGVGKAVIDFIKNAISGAAKFVIDGLKKVGTDAMEGFKKINWTGVGTAVINFIKDAISSGAHLVIDKLRGVGNDAMEAFKKIDWRNLGSNIVNGIISGISDFGGKLVDSMRDLANSAVKAAKKALKIKSPSKVFAEEVGKWIPEGMAIGIDANTDSVEKSLASVRDLATDNVFTGSITSPSNTQPTLTSGSSIVMNVYGAVGQDVQELANIVSQRLSRQIEQRRLVFA